MNLFYNKIYIICYADAQIQYLRKILFLRQTKVLSANQIAGFLNQLFLHSKSMKQPFFLMLIQIHKSQKLI